MSIDYINQTLLGAWERCQVQVEFRWLREIIIPPGLAAHIGTGLHKGNEVNLKAKMITGMDEPLSVVLDAARDGYVNALKRQGVMFPPDELSTARQQMADGVDVTVGVARTYREKVAPLIQPAFVERTIEIDHESLSLPMRGTIDIYTTEKEWMDLKTAAKKWPQSRADSAIQATLYNELIGRADGEYPHKLSYQVLVKGGKEPQTLVTSRHPDDFETLLLRAGNMMRSIEAGIFHPASAEDWICSPKYCGYWNLCPYVPKHKKSRRG